MAYLHVIIEAPVVQPLIFKDGITRPLETLSIENTSSAERFTAYLRSLKADSLKESNTAFFAINSYLFDSQPFRQGLRELCEILNISYYFVPEYYLLPSLSLSWVKPVLKKGEKIAVFSVIIGVSYFIFEYDGHRYQFYEEGHFEFPINNKRIIKNLKDTPGLKRVIITKINLNVNAEKLLTKLLRSHFKLDEIDVKDHSDFFNGSKVADHLNAKVLIPQYPDLKDYQCFMVEIGQPHKKVLFKAEEFINLPFEKSSCFIVKNEKSVILKNGSIVIKELNIAQFKGLKIKVSFSIGINSFYELTTTVVDEPPVEPPVEVLPIANSNDKLSGTKPMIVFTADSFSVFLNNQTALKDSYGKSRIPLYISFAKKKIEIGDKAIKAAKTDPTFVVYDILKFCLDDTDVSSNANRNFNVSKDNENNPLLEFDTFEGRRKAHLPFLIALLLKHTLKMIKTETKEVPSELNIGFKDIEITNKLMIIFLKAADLLKIKLSFV